MGGESSLIGRLFLESLHPIYAQYKAKEWVLGRYVIELRYNILGYGGCRLVLMFTCYMYPGSDQYLMSIYDQYQ